MKKYLHFFLLIPLMATSQTQIGQKIEGDNGTDNFGRKVSMSHNGNIVAVSSSNHNSFTGHVRVFENVSSIWTQLGADILGTATNDRSGSSIALSADGDVLAVGSPTNNNSNGVSAGHVRVFQYSSGSWIQLGNTIEGIATGDSFGETLDLSADGNILAVGLREHNGNGQNSGQVRIYQNVQGSWTQLGQNINGLQPGDGLGISLSLSDDGSIVAIGANAISTAGGPTGYTVVYQNVVGNWTQLGQVIYGTGPNHKSGYSTSLSSDGNILAIGAINANVSGTARIFENIGGTWTQIGQDINAEGTADANGNALSLSSDGTILAVAASINEGSGPYAGHVRIFKNVSNSWIQMGNDIDAEEAYDQFGSDVALSASGSELIVGAAAATTGNFKKGYAKVYDLSGVLSTKKISAVNFNIYPNPSTDVLNIELDDNVILENITIYNNLGQKVKSVKTAVIDVSNLAKGLYLVEVTTNLGKADQKVIIK